MKSGNLFLLFCIVVSQMLHAQSDGLTSTQQHVINKLTRAAKSGSKQQIASLVAYPLKRTYPLGDVKNKTEMLARFDVIFDTALLRQIAESKTANWAAAGWRGLMLNNGMLWIDDAGRITAINYQSEKEKVLLNKAIQKDKQQLPSSLQQFVKPLYLITTTHYRIRIDELTGNQLRYSSWSLQNDKRAPDLVLYSGVFEAQGTGGNHTITFTNKEYRYVVSINRLGTSETPEALLTVYKEEKALLNDPGIIKSH